jgi:hypothetical protein
MSDEFITLELAPNNIIRLNSPDGGPGAVFQASVWVEHSILVSFQTTRLSTEKGVSSERTRGAHACSSSWTKIATIHGVMEGGEVLVGPGVLHCWICSLAADIRLATCGWSIGVGSKL